MEKHTLNLSGSSRENRPLSPLKSPLLRRHFAPIQANIRFPAELHSPVRQSFKHVSIGNDGFFRSSVDVHDYKPEEIKLKTVGHTIILELSHGDKSDEHGIISRNFNKKFVLPPTMAMDRISSWTSKGILYIKVPPTSVNEQPERVIEIKHETPSNEAPSA
jgi:Hsp20/alpha crystallin family